MVCLSFEWDTELLVADGVWIESKTTTEPSMDGTDFRVRQLRIGVAMRNVAVVHVVGADDAVCFDGDFWC